MPKNNKALSDKAIQSRMKETPIAVVGMASIFADAPMLDKYWDNILDGVDSIIDVPASRWNIDDYYSEDKTAADKTYCKRGAFMPEVDFDPMEFGLPPNILEVTDIAQLIALIVAKEVMADAGIADEQAYDRDRIGITLGVGGGLKQIGALNARLQYPILEKVLDSCGIADADRDVIIDKFKKAYIPWEENSFPGMLGNVIAGRVANRFNLGGMNCTVDAACAGSLAAMKLAVSDLLEGRSDMMISGGICCDNSPFMYMSFSKTPAFTTNDTIRPFDDDSKGMMVGEGAGMVMLKRLEDAERDGDRIYAVLKGIGTSSDGRFKSIYAPRPEGQAKALARAYADAGVDPKTVGLIEAHGTGTLAGDAAEFRGLQSFFGEDNPEQNYIGLGSVKSQIGHTKSAAGAAGFIKLCLALHHKILPPTINVDKPSEQLDLANSPFYLNTETRPWFKRQDEAPRTAGVSSFGFGGTNFHFVLQEHKDNAEAGYRLASVPQSFLLAADSASAIGSAVADVLGQLNQADAEAKPFVFNNLAKQYSLRNIADDQARLGLVAKDAQQLLSLLEQAQTQLAQASENWSLPTGVFYRSKAMANAKTVALFSGQGSQYTNMGKELAMFFPPVMQSMQTMDQTFAKAGLSPLTNIAYPIPVFNSADRKAQQQVLQQTQFAQPAIGAFSVGLLHTLQQAGFKADMAAGHSFGELTALYASGVVDHASYNQLAMARGQAMAAPDDKNFDAGTMIAVVGDVAQVEKLVAPIDDAIVANFNSLSQVVVAGKTDAVAKAKTVLSDAGLKVVPLPVSAAFHTPQVGHAQKPFAKQVDKVQFNKPSIPVYSNGSGKKHPNDASKIKSALKKHILEPVYFSQQLENIYADGGRIFIEFGPKNVLTKLVENVLAEHDDVIAIALNAATAKDADHQLRQAVMQLAVCGLDLSGFDPYQAACTKLELPKKSPMAMKLSAASYVSPKTQQAFEDALNDGYKVASAEPQIVEKIIEKPVYIQAESPAPVASNSSASVDQNIQQFYEHQSQLLNVHEQYLQGSQNYAQTVQNVLANNSQDVPQNVQQSLTQYHQFQNDTAKVHQQYLQTQTQLFDEMMTQTQQQFSSTYTPASPAPVSVQTPVQVAVQPQVAPQVDTMNRAEARVQPSPVSTNVSTPVVHAEPVAAAPEASVNIAEIEKVMLAAVADKTGYPVEMLELSMDMEADLGIDSIKRVEILGAVQDEVPNLPELNPEDLAELRTLGQIVDYMQSKAGDVPAVQATAQTTTQPVAVQTAAIDTAAIEKVMLAAVADKTGYPVEMLELSMDMEADLGIDSIKRVEILGAVQDEVPNLPELNPEDLAELRTLGQIVEYMQSKAGSVPAAAQTTTQPVATQTATIDTAAIEKVMLAAVADKTGYPVDMLELSMDMEADLGIDSIKRVEILGAVQDEVPNLPELNPEDLAELRTLGQIVEYMQSKAGGVLAAQAVVAQTVVQPATIDTAAIEKVMLAAVADKTGYPVDMLELSMDMEADLGIDSIKRVEILGAVQDEVPNLPVLNPEDLAELRTLGQIVEYMESKAGSVPVATQTATIDTAAIEKVMLAAVADKTGYPVDMLELSMDMEADLGIDSIKRVEILGAVQDEVPNLPELNPEDLAELRTLGQIVEYMQSKASGASAPSQGQQASSMQAVTGVSPQTAVMDANEFSNMLLQSVSEKTGYPVEMLELDMDMEADLGIDSIKRVEILGAVQDALPDLPEIETERLAETRTLSEIVNLFTAEQAQSNATQPAAGSDEKAPSGIVEIANLPELMQIDASFAGAAMIIVDDGHGTAVDLSKKLLAQDAKVTIVKPKWVSAKSKKALPAKANVVELEQADDDQVKALFENMSGVDAVIYLHPKYSSASLSFVDQSEQGVLLAFLMAKHCKLIDSSYTRPSFVSLTHQDGAFGLHKPSAEVMQGGLAGLIKTLSKEWSNVYCKALDVDDKLAANKTADFVFEHLLDADTQTIEVGLCDGQRVTPKAQNTDSYDLVSGNKVNQNSVFVVSGGAKGVTAHCIKALAKAHACNFILLGRSALLAAVPAWAKGINDANELKKAAMLHLQQLGEKPTPKSINQLVSQVTSCLQINETLDAIMACGGKATYVDVDVTDKDALKEKLQQAQQSIGNITGIIHGAGVLADKVIEQKTVADFQSVLHTKIHGLQALLAAVDVSKLEQLVLFSSAAGFYGNPAQSDYSIANEVLNKTALFAKQKHPEMQVLAFNWGPWDGGMVTDQLKAMFAERGVYVIPLDAGAQLFVNELSANDNRSPLILVGNDMGGGDTAKKL